MKKFRSPLDRGLKLGWGGFRLRDVISRKWREIKHSWQLITNTKSYVGFRWPWITLNVNLLLWRQCYAYCDQTVKEKISGFRYEVALYHSYAHINVWRRNTKGIRSNYNHNLGLTCRLYRECIVTKQLRIGSRGFHCKVANCLQLLAW